MTVDSSRILLRLAGRFSAAEASAGDGLVLRVAVLSLLPLETCLDGIEVGAGIFCFWWCFCLEGSRFLLSCRALRALRGTRRFASAGILEPVRLVLRRIYHEYGWFGLSSQRFRCAARDHEE